MGKRPLGHREDEPGRPGLSERFMLSGSTFGSQGKKEQKKQDKGKEGITLNFTERGQLLEKKNKELTKGVMGAYGSERSLGRRRGTEEIDETPVRQKGGAVYTTTSLTSPSPLFRARYEQVKGQ